MLDIRRMNSDEGIIFADKEGGTHRCCHLTYLGKNIEFPARADNIKVHIWYEDIDNLIKALKYAKEHWKPS